MSHTKLAEKHAYPVPNDANVNDQEGMTMREHFAGLAMQGLLSYAGVWGQTEEMENLAKWSVDAADALIEALEKEQ